MSKPPTKTTKTRPGLGSSKGVPRVDSAEMKRVHDRFRSDPPIAGSLLPPVAESLLPPVGESLPPPVAESLHRPRRLRDSMKREEEPDDESSTPSTPAPERATSWAPEAQTGTRQRGRSLRPPVTVDEVGAAAVKLARTTRRASTPKLIASRPIIAKAPIDARAAFVLSLVDGRNSVEAIVDMAAMPEVEVRSILQRLARLGLISLP